jgi:hypothetical protein
VKAKIDEIEQQMVGEGGFAPVFPRPRPPAFESHQPPRGAQGAAAPAPAPATPDDFDAPSPSRPWRRGDVRLPPRAAAAARPRARLPLHAAGPPRPPPWRRCSVMAGGLPPLAPMSISTAQTAERRCPSPSTRPPGAPDPPRYPCRSTDFGNPFAVEVSEVMHDPDLDEAVIAFANADFGQCEQRCSGSPARRRARPACRDLAGAVRPVPRHRPAAALREPGARLRAAVRLVAPQWYSLPKLVADAVAEEPMPVAGAGNSMGGDVGWVCPEHLDIEAVARLRSQTLQMPLPWVFDWSQLRQHRPEAAMQLSTLFRLWAGQQLEMRWLAGDRLFQVLQEAAPTGVRDADPAFWLTRLDALRLANRPDQFDETAIDYCVTYEVSPPSWEPTRCTVHISGSGMSTRNPPMSMISDVSTSFSSRAADDAAAGIEVAHVELSGQLVGDISATLGKLHGELGLAPPGQRVLRAADPRRLHRRRRPAQLGAGARGEGRSVHFVDAHRLVALFFGAMGINEHAKVQVRKV